MATDFRGISGFVTLKTNEQYDEQECRLQCDMNKNI